MRHGWMLALGVLGCGNGLAPTLDASTQDATSPDGGFGFDWDAATIPDVARSIPCDGGGFFITIDGDGPTRTLQSNAVPAAAYFTIPSAPWAQAYYGQGLDIGGSATPEGGTSIEFDVEIHKDADGGLSTVPSASSEYSYAYYTREDGTLFSPTSGLSASVTLTEGDAIVAGSFTATVVDSADAGLSLSGTFKTCRLPDFIGTTPHP